MRHKLSPIEVVKFNRFNFTSTVVDTRSIAIYREITRDGQILSREFQGVILDPCLDLYCLFVFSGLVSYRDRIDISLKVLYRSVYRYSLRISFR